MKAKKKLVGNVFGHSPDIRSVAECDAVVGDSLVGVEVELEGCRRIDRIMEDAVHWAVVNEGSLRNRGAEFIFIQPFGGKDIILALEELEEIVGKMGTPPVCSERTSVHVHVDVRDLSVPEYLNYMLLYLIFERSLFRVCGDERKSNSFCRAVTASQGLIDRIAHMVMDHDSIALEVDRLARERYTAMNVGAVQRFGSVEFRGHKGEWRKEPILRWVNLLLSLKEFSKQEIDWTNMLMDISQEGYSEFARRVFRGYTDHLASPEFDYEILEGLRDAQDIIYANKLGKLGGKFRPKYREDGEIQETRGIARYIEKKAKKGGKK